MNSDGATSPLTLGRTFKRLTNTNLFVLYCIKEPRKRSVTKTGLTDNTTANASTKPYATHNNPNVLQKHRR